MWLRLVNHRIGGGSSGQAPTPPSLHPKNRYSMGLGTPPQKKKHPPKDLLEAPPQLQTFLSLLRTPVPEASPCQEGDPVQGDSDPLWGRAGSGVGAMTGQVLRAGAGSPAASEAGRGGAGRVPVVSPVATTDPASPGRARGAGRAPGEGGRRACVLGAARGPPPRRRPPPTPTRIGAQAAGGGTQASPPPETRT